MKSACLRLLKRVCGDLDSSRPFIRLVQAHALSSAGDALVAVALAGSIFFSEDPKTASSRVALSLVLTMAPFAVVAPFLGPAVDRVQGGRRVILVTAAASRALVCLLMADALDQIWLYPIAFISLVFSKTHAVAKSASVPELVKSDTALVRANSVLALTAVLSGFVAGGLGYAVSSLAGGEWVVRFGAVIFAAAAVLALEVGTRNARPATHSSKETADELHYSGVFAAGVTMAVYRCCVGFLTFMIAFQFRRQDAPTWWFAIPITCSMIGSSLGNLVAPRLRGRVREEWILTGAGIAVFLTGIALAQGPSRVASSMLALVVGAAAGAAKLSFDALVQRDAPSAVQGRSFARFEAVFQLAWVLGALAPVVMVIDTRLGYRLLATASGGVAVWYTLARRRSGTHSVTETTAPEQALHFRE